MDQNKISELEKAIVELAKMGLSFGELANIELLEEVQPRNLEQIKSWTTKLATAMVFASGVATAILFATVLFCRPEMKPTYGVLLAISFLCNLLALKLQQKKKQIVEEVAIEFIESDVRIRESLNKKIQGIFIFMKIHDLSKEEQEQELRSILSPEIEKNVKRLLKMKG